MQERIIQKVFVAQEALEGAGVHLHRGFGYFELPLFDPFLLFDDFSGDRESDYILGFPFHPHRGIETVTYVQKGDVTHKDSMGNSGTIGSGDIQWMTAGSGIVHEEMPHGKEGLAGFQLWINLPKSHKMMSPRYQEIKAREIPVITEEECEVRVIAGEYKKAKGPVADIMVHPMYLDVTLDPTSTITLKPTQGDTSFIYVIEGAIETGGTTCEKGSIILHERVGDTVTVTAHDKRAHFLFVSGTPLNEPIAWHGPIVMNTDDEIRVALYELQNGMFIKTESLNKI